MDSNSIIADLVAYSREMTRNITEGVLVSDFDTEDFKLYQKIIDHLYFELGQKDKIIQGLLKPVVTKV